MYHIERFTDNVLGWHPIPFASHKNKTYCDGYVDALDSMYPSKPVRIIKTEKGETKVVRETKGRGEIQLN